MGILVNMLSIFLLHVCQLNYTSPRIVLAASGVDHDELVSIAEPLLSDIPTATGTGKPKSVYVGGEYRRAADSSVGFMISSHSSSHLCDIFHDIHLFLLWFLLKK